MNKKINTTQQNYQIIKLSNEGALLLSFWGINYIGKKLKKNRAGGNSDARVDDKLMFFF